MPPAVQLAINAEIFQALAATRLQDVPSVVQEMLYFAPLAIVLQLQRNGEFVTALDWFQLV